MITDTDKRWHPWPPEGRWVEFRWRYAVWMPVRPWYEIGDEQHDLEDINVLIRFKGMLPFLTWNIKLFGYGIHGYIGWKPIPVHGDPKFNWSKLPSAQKLIREGVLFTQFSIRGGIGKIS